MTSDALQAGTLDEVSFIEIASQIHRQRLTGSLYLTSGKAERKTERIVYFTDGEVYAAASTLGMDSALSILQRAGRVTEETSLRIQRDVAAGRSFSEALVGYGCVTADELNRLRIEHVKSIFNSLCEWTSGSFRFREADEVPGGTLGVNTTEMLLEGALFATIPGDFHDLTRDTGIWISAASQVTADLRLPSFSAFVLSCLDRPRNLVVLIESAKLDESSEDVIHQIFGLQCAGLATLTKSGIDEQRPQIRRAAAAASASDVRPVANELALMRPLIEDPATTRRRCLDAIRKDIRHIRKLLSEAGDDYAILGLKAGVPSNTVKHSYRQLVNHYHPDRHFQHADPVTLATLSEVLMAIRAAYETAIEHSLLSEIISANSERPPRRGRIETEVVPITRADGEIRMWSPNGSSKADEDDEVIREQNLAIAALKHRKALAHQGRGEYIEAIRLMNEAVAMSPDCARFHGDLAALLEKTPAGREEAEQHFIRATELEPGNLFYHLQLGGFYRAIGLLSRAEQQFVLALKIDPVDRAAATALDEIVSLRQTQSAGRSIGMAASAGKQTIWSRFFGRRNG